MDPAIRGRVEKFIEAWAEHSHSAVSFYGGYPDAIEIVEGDHVVIASVDRAGQDNEPSLTTIPVARAVAAIAKADRMVESGEYDSTGECIAEAYYDSSDEE